MGTMGLLMDLPMVHFFSWLNIWILIFPKGEFQLPNKCPLLQRYKWCHINKSRWRGNLLCKDMGTKYYFIWCISMASPTHFWLLKINLNQLSSLTMHITAFVRIFIFIMWLKPFFVSYIFLNNSLRDVGW